MCIEKGPNDSIFKHFNFDLGPVNLIKWNYITKGIIKFLL